MYLSEKYLLLLGLQIKISWSWIVDNNKNSRFICCPTFQSKLINLISRLVSETDQNEARARRQILKAWNYVKWNINWSKLFLGVATSNHPPAAIPGHQEQGRWLAPRLPLHYNTTPRRESRFQCILMKIPQIHHCQTSVKSIFLRVCDL